MGLHPHINPLFMDLTVDVPQTSTTAAESGPHKPKENEEEDEEFVFYFDCEFFVPDKEEKSGFALYRGTHCKVHWSSTRFDLDELKAACAGAAINNATGKTMTTLIKKSIFKDSGKWTAFITKTSNFPKGSNTTRKLLTADNVQTWVEEAHGHYPKKEAGVCYVVLHPNKVKEQQRRAARAEVITALAEKRIAEHKRKRQTSKRKDEHASGTGTDDYESEHSKEDDYDSESTITSEKAKSPDNAWAAELVKKHRLDVNYNDDYAPIIDPKDSTRYFALTMEKAEEWAKYRNNDEVDFNNPPAHMKYDLIKKKDKGSKDTPSGSGFDASSIATLFVGMVNAIDTARSPQKQTSAASDRHGEPQSAQDAASPPPSSSPPIVYDPSGPNGIDGFLHYCTLPPNLHTTTRQLLRDAGVSDYRHINKDDLPPEDLAAKGLNKIAINTLYSNASKYKKRRIQERKANRIAR